MTSLKDDDDVLPLAVLLLSPFDSEMKDADVSWKEDRAWYASDFCCAMNCSFSFASSSLLDMSRKDCDGWDGGGWMDGRLIPLPFRMV